MLWAKFASISARVSRPSQSVQAASPDAREPLRPDLQALRPQPATGSAWWVVASILVVLAVAWVLTEWAQTRFGTEAFTRFAKGLSAIGCLAASVIGIAQVTMLWRARERLLAAITAGLAGCYLVWSVAYLVLWF